MGKLVLAVVGVLVLAGSAQGQADSASKCAGDAIEFEAFPCSHSFIARQKPQRWTFAHGTPISSYASRWITTGGRKFLTGSREDCTMFSRYKGLRVREHFCKGVGPLTVAVRSVAGPTLVRFSFAVLR